MQYAKDSMHNKVYPAFSGQRAICPFCDGDVVACCGDVYDNYWRHIQIPLSCDSWQDNETAWHREWKLRFPKEWCEVIIEKDGIKHRADVKTQKGLVIEFQNSFLPVAEIKARESFYMQMIWVINASDFAKNILKTSLVTLKLNYLDNIKAEQIKYFEDEYSEAVNRHDKKISEFENNINKQKYLVRQNETKAAGLEKLHSDINNQVELILSAWEGKQYSPLDPSFHELAAKLECHKKELEQLYEAISKNEKLIHNRSTTIHQALDMEDILIEGKRLKLVPFRMLPKQAYNCIFPLLQKNKGELFPTYVTLKAEADLMFYQGRQEYVFAFDVALSIEILNAELERLMKENEENHSKLEHVKNQLLNISCEWIRDEMIRLKNENIEHYANLQENKTIKTEFEQRKIKFISDSANERDSFISDAGKKNTIERSKAMHDLKGKYEVHWKNERKSWKAAKCLIFFDTNQGYLWEKIGEKYLKKISVEDFLARYLV